MIVGCKPYGTHKLKLVKDRNYSILNLKKTRNFVNTDNELQNWDSA